MSDGEQSLLFRSNQIGMGVMTPILPPHMNGIFNEASGAVDFSVGNPALHNALNPHEPIDVLGEKAMNSINLPSQMPSMAGCIKFEGNDMATLGLRTMETMAEFGGAVFSALTDKPDPGAELVAQLEQKFEKNVRTPPPPQFGMGVGGGPG